MNKIISLTKLDLKNTFGSKNTKESNGKMLRMIALLALMPIYLMVIKNIGLIYNILSATDKTSIFMELAILVATFIIILSALTGVMNKLYFTSDTESLMVLPIKTGDILASKFIGLIIQQYMLVLPIMFPFIVINGRGGGYGLVYYINSIIMTLTLPIFPMAILTIIVMVLMKITNIGKRKDAFRVLGSIIILFAMIIFQIKLQQNMGDNLLITEDVLFLITGKLDNLLSTFGKLLPTIIFGARFVNSSSILGVLLNGLIYVGINLLAYFIMTFVGEKIYIDGLLSGGSLNSNVKASKKQLGDKAYSIKKPYIALAKREILTVIKTPVYLTNSIVGMLMMPLILFMTLRSSGSGMDMIGNYYVENNINFLCILILVLIGLNMGNIATTSFSREGKTFWLQKTLPISINTQIKGRILSSLVIQWLGLLAILVTVIYLGKMTFIDIIIGIVVGTISLIPAIEINLLVDSSRPKLDWSSPEEAMKQNMNVLFSMGLNIIYIGVLAFVIYQLKKFFTGYSIFIAIIIVDLIIIRLLKKPLEKSVENLINN